MHTRRNVYSTHTTHADKFAHPHLTASEMNNGCRLGLDSWADTSCAGKHAYIESFIEGKTVNATGFSSALGSLNNLPIVNALYAYDTHEGQTLIIENNNAIYLGSKMEDSLVNPIQAEDNDVRIDLRHKRFYPQSSDSCQKVIFEDGTIIPVEYDGVLPFLPVRRPTPVEIDTCKRVTLTSSNEWNPFQYSGFITQEIDNTSNYVERLYTILLYSINISTETYPTSCK